MSDPKNPTVGEFHIDGSEFEQYAVDLPPGGLQGLLFTHDGFLEAASELIAAQASYGKAAGIPDGDIADLSLINERVARLDLFLPAYSKLVEMLTETRGKLDDLRERIVLNAAKSVDRRAAQNITLLAKYEGVRAYRSAIAKKALKTKAAKAKQNGAGDVTNTPQADPPTPPTA